MPIKKSAEVGELGKPAPTWMVSYSDLVTQLLTFFIMLFALSAAATEDQLKKIKQKIDNYVLENRLEKFVSTKITQKEGLIISFSEKYMFDSGKADIYDEAKEVIKNIASLLLDEPNRISIEGHTDNTPINTPEFPSNWELSTKRATNVLKYLLEELKFDPKRLTAAGFGEWHPVAPNDTPENKAKNRRVDLIVRRLDIEEMREWRAKLAESLKKSVRG
ncbi:MAG: OmpA family protein [Elusimicrobiota bacterium]|nr:OmpA family protein [Endomicrobiia bacterium]MDW8166280.1 OmpA family protein [Elusimicrobiota bacterium]